MVKNKIKQTKQNLLREKAATTSWESIYNKDINTHRIINIPKTCIPNRLTQIRPALWSTAGKGLTSLLSFVVSNCDVTFPLVSSVRCGD